MNCFPCFSSQRSKKTKEHVPDPVEAKPAGENKQKETSQILNGNIAAPTFTFRELATATRNFRQECLLGEGGFGRVYKGTLPSSGKVVAVKQLDRNGVQGNKEFMAEVLMLSLLHHKNLVNLIGYCADGDQRLLVYEYMSGGTVDDHLLDLKPDQKPLDWATRIKISYGAAQGLEYLHDKANPPVIYRDLKSSNILLDQEFNPKLSDFGLAKLGPMGEKMPLSSRVVGTYGYCAPEYSRSGHVTLKSDVYSFGVVLLELITGRRAIDTTKPIDEQNLVAWAQPMFRDPKKFPDMADPLLNKQFPEKDLNQAVAIAAMCLQEEPAGRPLMSDVVTALSFLSMAPNESIPAPIPAATPQSKEKVSDQAEFHQAPQETDSSDQDQDSSDESDGEGKKHQSQDNSDHEEIISEEHNNKESMDEDVSECNDADDSDHRQDNGSEDEWGHAFTENNKWVSRSSRRSSLRSIDKCDSSSRKSSMRSIDQYDSPIHRSSVRSKDKYNSSSRKSSMRSQEGSVSSSHKESMRSDDGSVSSRDQSNRGSGDQDFIALSQKSSRKSFLSMSRKRSKKSSKMGSFTSSRMSSRSLFSLSRKSSRQSHEGSVSFSDSDSENVVESSNEGSVSSIHKSSQKSQEGSVSSREKSSRSVSLAKRNILLSLESSMRSNNENPSFKHSSSKGSSQSGSVCLDHNSSRGSRDGSVHSS